MYRPLGATRDGARWVTGSGYRPQRPAITGVLLEVDPVRLAVEWNPPNQPFDTGQSAERRSGKAADALTGAPRH